MKEADTRARSPSSIDLTSANYVHLMEPHWNPMAEEQAVARVHRIGQLRPVTTIKYITPRSIEAVSNFNNLSKGGLSSTNYLMNQYVLEIQREKLTLSQRLWTSQPVATGE